MLAGAVAAGALRAVEVAAVVFLGILVCPPVAVLPSSSSSLSSAALVLGLLAAVVAAPFLLVHHFRGHRGGHLSLLAHRLRGAVRALIDLAPHRIVADARKVHSGRSAQPPQRRSVTCGRVAPASAADDHGRAVLRPRLRLRGHAAVAPDPRRPHRRRRRARRLPAARRVVGVDLHDLDGQLVRPGLLVGGPRGADGGDARQPAHGRRAARGVR